MSNVSLNEKLKQDQASFEWKKRKELIEFIMLENRCSFCKALQILEESEKRRKEVE